MAMLTTETEVAGGIVVLLRLGLLFLTGLFPSLTSLVVGLRHIPCSGVLDSRKDPRVGGPGALSRNISDLWKAGLPPYFC